MEYAIKKLLRAAVQKLLAQIDRILEWIFSEKYCVITVADGIFPF